MQPTALIPDTFCDFLFIIVLEAAHEKQNNPFAIACDSWTDMARFMQLQCNLTNLKMPNWTLEWINITTIFHSFYRLPRERRSHLKTMLQDLGLSLASTITVCMTR